MGNDTRPVAIANPADDQTARLIDVSEIEPPSDLLPGVSVDRYHHACSHPEGKTFGREEAAADWHEHSEMLKFVGMMVKEQLSQRAST